MSASAFEDGEPIEFGDGTPPIFWKAAPDGAGFTGDDITVYQLTETPPEVGGRGYPQFINSSAAQVPTLAALQGLQNTVASGIYPRVIHLLGGVTRSDGREGHFIVDPTDSTSTDNGGTLFVTAGGLRAKRQHSGPIDKNWGTSLATAMSVAPSSPYNIVQIPEGTHVLPAQIMLPINQAGHSVRGSSWSAGVTGGTHLTPDHDDTMFTVAGGGTYYYGARWEHVSFDHAAATNGHVFDFPADATISDCTWGPFSAHVLNPAASLFRLTCAAPPQLHWFDFKAYGPDARRVPLWDVGPSSSAQNLWGLEWRHGVITGTVTDTAPMIRVDQGESAGHCYCIAFRDLILEVTTGGGIECRSLNNLIFEHVCSVDTYGLRNPVIWILRAAGGLAPRFVRIDSCETQCANPPQQHSDLTVADMPVEGHEYTATCALAGVAKGAISYTALAGDDETDVLLGLYADRASLTDITATLDDPTTPTKLTLTGPAANALSTVVTATLSETGQGFWYMPPQTYSSVMLRERTPVATTVYTATCTIGGVAAGSVTYEAVGGDDEADVLLGLYADRTTSLVNVTATLDDPVTPTALTLTRTNGADTLAVTLTATLLESATDREAPDVQFDASGGGDLLIVSSILNVLDCQGARPVLINSQATYCIGTVSPIYLNALGLTVPIAPSTTGLLPNVGLWTAVNGTWVYPVFTEDGTTASHGIGATAARMSGTGAVNFSAEVAVGERGKIGLYYGGAVGMWDLTVDPPVATGTPSGGVTQTVERTSSNTWILSARISGQPNNSVAYIFPVVGTPLNNIYAGDGTSRIVVLRAWMYQEL
jgi:IMP cyclohydrolase